MKTICNNLDQQVWFHLFVKSMGIEYVLQVGDFAAKGGTSHEQGERNVISAADQNIFLAEKTVVEFVVH